MAPSDTEAQRRLVELSEDECWRLLASGRVGRIAWIRADRPFVIPVNFTVERDRIYIQSSSFSALVQEVNGSLVAFQVDDVDASTRSGWTVVAQGRAETRAPAAMTPTDPSVDVWPAGLRPVSIVIDVTEVSGRRL